jgi:hypothetical protein
MAPRWNKRGLIPLGLLLLGLLAAVASPLPDGLEWAMEKLGLAASTPDPVPAPLPGYEWPLRLPPAVQGLLTVILGGGLVWLILRLLAGGGKSGGQGGGKP